jgi:hypothetical protein
LDDDVLEGFSLAIEDLSIYWQNYHFRTDWFYSGLQHASIV